MKEKCVCFFYSSDCLIFEPVFNRYLAHFESGTFNDLIHRLNDSGSEEKERKSSLIKDHKDGN